MAREASWSHLLLTASKPKSSLLLCGVELWGLIHLSKFWAVTEVLSPHAWICMLGPLQLIFVLEQGGFHLDEHAGWAAQSLYKDVSPTICLSGLKREWIWP